MLYTVKGTYGSGLTECKIYVKQGYHGLSWYVVEGSSNVNATYNAINDGVDVETLIDEDCFTWSKPIYSENELEIAINS